jgi:ribosomal protein S18 acetylase RimI-like enzyme
VELRPALPGDEEFLLALYRSTREDELALTGWDEPQRAAFVRMQFLAQRQHYQAAYPDAAHEIVVRDGRAIGRRLVARDAEQILLVDVALLPEHRGAGIGDRLVRELIGEGETRGVPVRLHVLRGNPAIRLYERLGFVVTGESGLHLLMERPPGR